jgi:vacuolar-type H+-ATPase subunit H
VANDTEEFPRSVRGYDRDTVDRVIAKLRRELMTTKTLFDEQAERMRDLENTIAELRHDAEHMSKPSAATLNTRLHRLLREAEKEATEIVARATAEAERMQHVSARDRERVEADLNARVANERSVALSEAHVLVSSAKSSAERIVDDARRRAHRLVEEAERVSGEVRGATATEAARLKATARNESEAMIAEAARGVSEFKLRFATDITEGRVARLGRELAGLLKLEAEISVRREEAEKTYTLKHNEAVLVTQKYLEEAEAQLRTLRADIREAELTALAIMARAEREAIDVVADASSQVETMVANAREEAVRLVDSAETRSASILADAEERASQLIAQREAINSFVVTMNTEAQNIATREQKKDAANTQT